ncbi:MAG: efflux RND transporter periplasmic adaptor subunit [Candidatus Sumerlaeaceae bacterium]|nr:efflux RND transporter periplasmic adaptor subunit [Candidatus Sumerlaeaceae bacterium]
MDSVMRWTIGIGIAFLLIFAGCGKAPAPAPGATGKPAAAVGGKTDGAPGQGPKKFGVRVKPVSTQPVVYVTEAIGSLVEENRFEIPAQVEGTAVGVGFSEGDRVTTNQEMMRIDYDRYKLRVDKAQNDLSEAEATVRTAEAALEDAVRQTSSTEKQARLDYELAKSEYDRRANLTQGSVISSEDRATFEMKYRRALTSLEDSVVQMRTLVLKAQAALNEKRAALGAKKAELALAEDDLKRAVIRAPIAGTILERRVTNGQFLKSGDKVAVMVQTDPLRLKFMVPESKAESLSKDMEVRFSVNAIPGKEFHAKVYSLGEAADAETREVPVWGRLANPDGLLRPGYFAKVSMETATKKSSVVVPLASVLPTEIGTIAYVVQDGLAVRRKIKTGLQVTGDSIEVLSGLEPGEQLVVEGMGSLQDNVPVDVKEGAGDAKLPAKPIATSGLDNRGTTTVAEAPRPGAPTP